MREREKEGEREREGERKTVSIIFLIKIRCLLFNLLSKIGANPPNFGKHFSQSSANCTKRTSWNRLYDAFLVNNTSVLHHTSNCCTYSKSL